jgi:hypothetical protein
MYSVLETLWVLALTISPGDQPGPNQALQATPHSQRWPQPSPSSKGEASLTHHCPLQTCESSCLELVLGICSAAPSLVMPEARGWPRGYETSLPWEQFIHELDLGPTSSARENRSHLENIKKARKTSPQSQ